MDTELRRTLNCDDKIAVARLWNESPDPHAVVSWLVANGVIEAPALSMGRESLQLVGVDIATLNGHGYHEHVGGQLIACGKGLVLYCYQNPAFSRRLSGWLRPDQGIRLDPALFSVEPLTASDPRAQSVRFFRSPERYSDNYPVYSHWQEGGGQGEAYGYLYFTASRWAEMSAWLERWL